MEIVCEYLILKIDIDNIFQELEDISVVCYGELKRPHIIDDWSFSNQYMDNSISKFQSIFNEDTDAFYIEFQEDAYYFSFEEMNQLLSRTFITNLGRLNPI